MAGYPGVPPQPAAGGPGVPGANPYGYQQHQSQPPPQAGLPIPSPEQRFQQVAGAAGTIDAEQLQHILSDAGFNDAFKTQFSLETCRIMVSMLDRDYNGTMNGSEFRELLNVLWGWRQTFDRFDRDRSGTIEPHELYGVVQTLGYNLSARAQYIISQRYSRKQGAGGPPRIFYDDFVALCVRLRGNSEAFRRRDREQNGWATFHYDDFLQTVMAL